MPVLRQKGNSHEERKLSNSFNCLDDKLFESNIKTTDESDDKILVSLEEVKAIEHGFTFGSLSKIKIEIPAIERLYRGCID